MQFERPHHQRIAHVLSAMNGETLLQHGCLFGGGTCIALRYGEYRESVDIDFLVSDAVGYRELRHLLTGPDGLAAISHLHAPPLVVLRDTPPLDAMKLSLTACFNNFGAFVVLGVLIYVLIWVALLPLGLGMLVLVPVLAGTLHASFLDVFGAPPALAPAGGTET